MTLRVLIIFVAGFLVLAGPLASAPRAQQSQNEEKRSLLPDLFNALPWRKSEPGVVYNKPARSGSGLSKVFDFSRNNSAPASSGPGFLEELNIVKEINFIEGGNASREASERMARLMKENETEASLPSIGDSSPWKAFRDLPPLLVESPFGDTPPGLVPEDWTGLAVENDPERIPHDHHPAAITQTGEEEETEKSEDPDDSLPDDTKEEPPKKEEEKFEPPPLWNPVH